MGGLLPEGSPAAVRLGEMNTLSTEPSERGLRAAAVSRVTQARADALSRRQQHIERRQERKAARLERSDLRQSAARPPSALPGIVADRLPDHIREPLNRATAAVSDARRIR